MKNLLFIFLFPAIWVQITGQPVNAQGLPDPESVNEIILLDPINNLYQAGDFFISGQPDDSVFLALKKSGLGLVINVRTPQEMEALKKEGFDEQSFLDSLGISYVNSPIGGDAGFTEEAIEKIDEALQKQSGKVMIHCRSANRATMAWVAWLINYQDVPVDAAFSMGRQMQLNLQMEDLLGYELTYEKK